MPDTRRPVKRPRPRSQPAVTLTPAAGRRLAAALEATGAVELGCEAVYQLLDACAEAAARGEDISQVTPLVHQHLQMCPACREEYEALVRLVKTQPPGGRP